jgi:hypothetical protein
MHTYCILLIVTSISNTNTHTHIHKTHTYTPFTNCTSSTCRPAVARPEISGYYRVQLQLDHVAKVLNWVIHLNNGLPGASPQLHVKLNLSRQLHKHYVKQCLRISIWFRFEGKVCTVNVSMRLAGTDTSHQ